MSLVSPCFELSTSEDRRANYSKLRSLPLEDKILYSTVKIKQFYIARKGKVYVSFSGGKDSTVLLHLVRSVYPDVPAVYIDTGLEFPEIREFARSTPGVEFVRPKKTFKQVVIDEGYPVIGKEAAHYISLARRGLPSGIDRMQRDDRYGYARFSYLVDAPFKVSENCCRFLKKNPARDYTKETGRVPYIGTRAGESQRRETEWLVHGENLEDCRAPHSTPLSIWTEDDIWEYIHRFDLPYSPIYDMGYEGTGCIFCMFGIMSDRDRFLRLKATHPKLWAYCMKPVENGGLGLKTVLDYMGIPTGCEQTNLHRFAEVE